MHKIAVEIVGQGIDWPAWVQGVGSVFAIGVSIWLGLWLPGRDRSKKDAAELQTQVAALIAIGQRCVEGIGRLRERAKAQSFRSDEWAWLTDETEATQAAAAVDLMSLRSPLLTEHVAKLQEATRTARRRLSYAKRRAGEGKEVKDGDFDEPLLKAEAALNAIKEMQRSS